MKNSKKKMKKRGKSIKGGSNNSINSNNNNNWSEVNGTFHSNAEDRFFIKKKEIEGGLPIHLLKVFRDLTIPSPWGQPEIYKWVPKDEEWVYLPDYPSLCESHLSITLPSPDHFIPRGVKARGRHHIQMASLTNLILGQTINLDNIFKYFQYFYF